MSEESTHPLDEEHRKATETPPEETPKPRNKGGRPKGSRNKKKTPPPPPEPELTPEQIAALEAMAKKAIGGLWNIPVVKYDLPPLLSEEEKMILGDATLPVIEKYFPDVFDGGPELTLALTVYTVFGSRLEDKRERETRDGPIKTTAEPVSTGSTSPKRSAAGNAPGGNRSRKNPTNKADRSKR